MPAQRKIARMAATFYALNIVTILMSILLRHSVSLHQPLQIISTACSIVVAALLYEVLKPVDEALSLVAAFFRLTACSTALVGYVFKPAANMVIILFGFHFIVIGSLIFRAGYRVLGALATFAGCAALIFFAPPIATPLFPYFAAVGLVTELSVTAWLFTARFDRGPWM